MEVETPIIAAAAGGVAGAGTSTTMEVEGSVRGAEGVGKLAAVVSRVVVGVVAVVAASLDCNVAARYSNLMAVVLKKMDRKNPGALAKKINQLLRNNP
eukprot:scaffold3023_cov175-Amphora_coffeaeformis.AAC.11